MVAFVNLLVKSDKLTYKHGRLQHILDMGYVVFSSSNHSLFKSIHLLGSPVALANKQTLTIL